MLYSFLKIPARFVLLLYCRHISISNKAALECDGPLLLACNHPNSFLDAVIIATLFKRPVYSLTRGDAFANKFTSKILAALHMLPVYRISEGAGFVEHNYKTFDDCMDIFRRNGIVLIFSEGLCVNEWHLRPLKKGTARLVLNAWDAGIPLQVLPVGINYSSFNRFGKNIQLNFGEKIKQHDTGPSAIYGKKIAAINDLLNQQLQKLVVEIDDGNIAARKKYFFVQQPLIKKILLSVPAISGWLLHLPIYFFLKKIITKSRVHPAHFDSMMMGGWVAIYPFYLLLIALVVFFLFGGWYWVAVFFLLPFFAWSYVQLKGQF